MRQLLPILLLIGFSAKGQITVASFSATDVSTTNATSVNISNATFTAGNLYIFIAVTTGTTNNGTLTTTTTTWTNEVNVGDATRRVQIFSFRPSTTITNESVSIGSFGGGSTGYYVKVLEIKGSTSVGQHTSATATTTSNPSLTLSSLSADGHSMVLAVFANDANTPTGTEEGGWTEFSDVGYNSPTSGIYVMYRIATTDNTPSYTASSSTWIGAAIEIKASSYSKSMPLYFFN